MNERKNKQNRLKVLRTHDPKSLFTYDNFTPEEILDRLGRPRYLLSSSSKVEKSQTRRVLSRILYLTSGLYCPNASPGCLSTCLGFTSGRMGSDQATSARDRRSALYAADNDAFMALLRQDLHQLCYDAETQGMLPVVRLNGTGDLAWEKRHPNVFREFPNVQFYDYTKHPGRMKKFLSGRLDGEPWPGNYDLTFSAHELNIHWITPLLELSGNVAVVFWPELPKTWLGYRVIDGDKDDLRYLDPSPAIVGLRAKGVAREDLSGFVVRTDWPTAGLMLNRTNAA
ncbi:GP88 family protein [Bythopirellula goksoeyrii]